jgi:hypothetical protein
MLSLPGVTSSARNVADLTKRSSRNEAHGRRLHFEPREAPESSDNGLVQVTPGQ